MKNCGHMFREKLPFSELWEELHRVAILKRKVCVTRLHCIATTNSHSTDYVNGLVPVLAG